jgi:DNA replication factor GINS
VKYDDIVRIKEEEDKKQTLSRIPPQFYNELNIYIKEMEEEESEIFSKYSEAAIQIQYELKNALSIIDKIFKKRTRKIIKMATGKAFSKDPTNTAHDMENMTPQEIDIYSQVLQAILLGKKNTIESVLRMNTGIKPDSIPDNTQDNTRDYKSVDETAKISTEVELEVEQTTASIDDKIIVHDEKGKKDINKEYIVVRILKDIPTFIATDGRNYTLNAQELAVIPVVNARALIKRKVAGQVKSTYTG